MKIEKLSIAIGSLGIFVIFIYTWKFFIQSNFTSMWLIGCGVGFGMIFVAYMYDWMKKIDGSLEYIDNRIDAFNKWYAKEEFK